jgi:hypothetical protein
MPHRHSRTAGSPSCAARLSLALVAALAVFAPAVDAATAAAPAAASASAARAECDRLHQPSVGQAGKDVVWVPTPDELVTKMLQMAQVTAQDYVVDLGAGDGKIAIAAAKQFGARSLGIEYDEKMAVLAQCYARADGAAPRARIVRGDIFESDFSDATVVTMYLLPTLNLKLRPTLLDMRPGTRIVSHAFDMDDWQPDETALVEGRSAFLWIVPAKVGGVWQLREEGSREMRRVRLQQTFQKVEGEVLGRGPTGAALTGATVRGDRLAFSFADARGRTLRFEGTVSGETLTGTLTGPSGARKVTGTRLSAPT